MRRRLPLLVTAAGAVIVVVVGWASVTHQPDAPAAAPRVTVAVSPPPTPTRTRPPTPTPSPTPTAGEVPVAAPQRIEIPAVGIDLEVLPITPEGGVIDPPTVGAAYWIEAYGAPGTDAANTVYMVAHSSLRMAAAFNPLLDVEHQQSVLVAGDEVRVTTSAGVLRYAVTGSTRYVKGELPQAADVWAIDPGVLQLITCFQEDGLARAQDNLVVTARLVEGYPAG